MHDWLKKNQKKLLAVMGAFLMVSFLISVPIGSLTSGSRSRGTPVAHIGKTPVYADERKRAETQWRMLEQCYREAKFNSYLRSRFRPEQMEMLRKIPRIFPQLLEDAERNGAEVLATDLLGQSIQAQMKEHPDLFFLLIKEAERRGIRISEDAAATAAKNDIVPIGFTSAGEEAYRDAVRSLLLVQALRDEVVSSAKISEPQWKQMYSERFRGVRLNIVEFTVDQFKPLTPPPTTQQVDSLYNEFKNLPPESTKAASDTLTFGYQVPNRVKVQYLKIAHDKVMEAAKAAHRDTRDKPDEIPFELKERAYQYYLEHQDKYVHVEPASQPATAPATRPVLGPFDVTTQPATSPTTLASTTRPTTVASTLASKPKSTTKPFSEVADEIVDDLVKSEADKLETQVIEALRNRLSEDYLAFHRANPTTKPTTLPSVSSAITPATAPTTQPAYDSFDYLEKVAKDIQKRFGVLPEVTQNPQWQDSKELAALPGIGQSRTANSDSFSEYASSRAAAFANKLDQLSTSLQVWQPSEELTDSTHNAYLFRLTDASPAHAPALVEVRPRVEEDTRIKNAYTAAQEAAKKFIEAAKRDNFSRAALDDHRNPIQTDAFNINQVEQGGEIKNFQVAPAATIQVAEKAKELLAQITPSNPKPMAILPLPELKKVAVIQLDSVSMLRPEESLYASRLHETERFTSSAGEMIAAPYFDYKSVTTRLDYKPDESSKNGS